MSAEMHWYFNQYPVDISNVNPKYFEISVMDNAYKKVTDT